MIKKRVIKILKSRWFLNLLFQQDKESLYGIYYVTVDPESVSHISLIPEESDFLSGPRAIYGSFTGAFDLIKLPFKNHFMYKTVQQLLNGEEWEATPYFKKSLQYKDRDEVMKHLEKLNRYISVLSTKGYLSQYQLGRADITDTVGRWKVPRHEMIIGMDRKGRFFRIKGGRHRLAVAQNIGISEIPAILTLFHEDATHLLPVNRRMIRGETADFRPFKTSEYAR